MQRGSKGRWPKRKAGTYMAIAIGATLIGALAPGWERVSAGAAKDDEAIVRARIAEYAAAWNRADAKAVADCWSENGEYVSPDGDRVRGRDAIQKVFADTFKAEPGRAVEAGEYTVRFPVPTTAVIEGSAVFTKPGTEPAETSFLILLVKRDERWFIDSIRETHQPAKPKPSLKLK